MNVKRIFFSLLLTLGLGAACHAAAQSAEMRVLWVERWGITTPEACHTMVKAAKQYGYNTIVVQVRGKGDAYYKSNVEPRTEGLASQPADFDPLATILEDSRAAGIKVYAWLNACYIWGSNTAPKAPEHIVNTHPEWLMRNKNNEVVMASTPAYDGCFCCPGHRAFVSHLTSVFADLVKNYDVDGVCLDFIRYPNSNFCYCDYCLSRFKAEMDAKISADEKAKLAASTDRLAYPLAYPEAWSDFRRGLITNLMYSVHDAVKAVKPGVMVSASVFPGSADAYNDRLQDWKRWLKDGRLDMLYPMAYYKSTESYVKAIKVAMDASNGIPVCPNIGSYLIDAESTVEKIQKSREMGTVGAGVYCWAITDDGKDCSYLQKVYDLAYSPKAQSKH